MNKSFIVGAALLAICPLTNATIISSSNTADFNLTSEQFANVPLGTNSNIISDSGNVTLDNANGIGNPITGTHGYTDWSATLTGREYVLNGDENFDVIFSSLQSVFAITYEDDSIASTFTLSFMNGATNVGSASFVSSVFDTEQFIGFISDVEFNKVLVREDDGSVNSNEYFQFYTATVNVSEPTALALFSIGLIGLGFSRRTK